nr:hypothetical protein [Tanacetum cinerariifolium]
MEALIKDENAMDKGIVDTGKKTKRRRTKDLESLKKPSTTKETPKGKALSKGSKTGKYAPAKEPVKEPIAKVVMDDASDHDDNQKQDASEPKTTKTLNPDWKTKLAQYEIEGIEDMVHTLWSPTKVGYDKDALKGIKH